ncbi:hypothetical protein ES705_24660 [subsurface metagenome]
MVSQHEVDFMNMKIKALEKESVALNKKYEGRGKSLNKLWEKYKELKKEIVTLQKYCGKLTFDLSKLQLENRLIIPAETGAGTQILVRDLLRQLINESGYDLQFKVLQKRYPTIGKEVELSEKGKKKMKEALDDIKEGRTEKA